MASRKALWIVLGCGGFFLIVCAAFIGVVAIAVMRNADIRATPAATAEHEYSELRSHFQGQSPLIEMDTDNPGSVKVNRHLEKMPGRQVERIKVYAWTPKEGKVLRLTLPIWLLRLKSTSGTVKWDWNLNVRFEDLDLTLEDIELHGPGLLLDMEDLNGNRLLAWSE